MLFRRQNSRKKFLFRSLPALEGLETRVVPAAWISQGPGPVINGQVNFSETPGALNDQISGAVRTILTHPTDASKAWIGSVNGGIWKTTDANNAGFSPTWRPVTSQFPSLSIGAIEFDPSDPTYNTLIAGIGRYSSAYQIGGERTGVLKSYDGGETWNLLDGKPGASINGANVNGVYSNGSNIVVSAEDGNRGVFLSTDNGRSFQAIPQFNGGIGWCLENNGSKLYLAYSMPNNPSASGIFKSLNHGVTWIKISNSAIDGLLADPNCNNAKVSPSPVNGSDVVFAGVVLNNQLRGGTFNGQPAGVVFKLNPTNNTWIVSDGVGPTGASNLSDGLQPRAKPGSQGSIHFSMGAMDDNLVFVGGDRILNSPYTGNIFRVNFAATGGNPNRLQIQAMMDASGIVTDGRTPSVERYEYGTANGTAPHADSRYITFDALGRMWEGSDGGLSVRTNPNDGAIDGVRGNWYSLSGNLRTQESHSVALDPVSKVFITGNQDNGTTQQLSANPNSNYEFINGGDGGDVEAVSVNSSTSVRYFSSQFLGGFQRQFYNSSNTLLTSYFDSYLGRNFPSDYPLLNNMLLGDSFPFVAPIAANRIIGNRLLLGSDNTVYESYDYGDTLNTLRDNRGILFGSTLKLVYGGTKNSISNPDLVYYASYDYRSNSYRLFSRTVANQPLTWIQSFSSISNGAAIVDISVNPTNYDHVVIITSNGVYETKSGGATNDWVNLTSPVLTTAFPSSAFGFNTTKVIPLATSGAYGIFVGGPGGAYALDSRKPGQWFKFAPYLEHSITKDRTGATVNIPNFTEDGLPNAFVFNSDYYQGSPSTTTDDILVVSTMGQGVFSVANPAKYFDDIAPTLRSTTSLINLIYPTTNASNQLGSYVYDAFVRANNIYQDSNNDQFAGIAIVSNDYDPRLGSWQYSTSNGNIWYNLPSRIETNAPVLSDQNALVLRSSDLLRFVPAVGRTGTLNTLKTRMWDGVLGDYSIYKLYEPANISTGTPAFSDSRALKNIQSLVGVSFSTDANIVILGANDGQPQNPINNQDTKGARVVFSSVSDLNTGRIGSFTITFSEPIQPSTFTTSDIRFTSPSGSQISLAGTNITAVPNSNNTNFIISGFATQTANGVYVLNIGPDILDLAGNKMNQDGDSINGESTDDTFRGLFNNLVNSININNSRQVQIRDISKATSQITINENINIKDLDVALNISHTNRADLLITIKSPWGQIVTLSNRRGGTGDHFSNTLFDDSATLSIASLSSTGNGGGSYRPESPLGIFNGKSAKGIWTITVEDRATGNTGTSNSWKLIFLTDSKVSSATNLVNSDGGTVFANVPVGLIAGILQQSSSTSSSSSTQNTYNIAGSSSNSVVPSVSLQAGSSANNLITSTSASSSQQSRTDALFSSSNTFSLFNF